MVAMPASSTRARRVRCVSLKDSGRASISSHTGLSHWRATASSPPSACMRWAARRASSGMVRSAGSSESHTACSWPASCAWPISSAASVRTRLRAASGAKARCLASRRAVSMASWMRPDWRAALSLRRSAAVRRLAPVGNSSSRARAPAGSWSCSDQRVARSSTPSRSSAAPPRLAAVSSAWSKCASRVAWSCRACALSATVMWASVRRASACGGASPAPCSACSRASAPSAALRARRNRPALNCVKASSNMACVARSRCWARQRRA